jgi:hypothetical protein
MKEYEFHPFADAFPMMSDQEHAELVADIKANGQREAITRYHGKLLDGRNRHEACRELGIKANYNDFGGDDDDALAFVISKNLVRRQLTASQRAMVADKLTTLELGQRKSDTSKDVSQPDAAKLVNASLPSTQRARTVRTKGTPELAAAVLEGDVPVTSASEFAKQHSPAEQTQLIEQHGSPAGAIKAAKANNSQRTKPDTIRETKKKSAKTISDLRKELATSRATNRLLAEKYCDAKILQVYDAKQAAANSNPVKEAKRLLDQMNDEQRKEAIAIVMKDDISTKQLTDDRAGNPSKVVLKFCAQPLEFAQTYHFRLTTWLLENKLNDRDKDEILTSIQTCADAMQQLAQTLRD